MRNNRMPSKVHPSFFVFLFFVCSIFVLGLYFEHQRVMVPLPIPSAIPQSASPSPRSSPQPHSAGVLGAQTKAKDCVAQEMFPDPDCTPGAIFPDVTKEEVCTPGYSSKVRDVS